jgi:hypothetical protein
MRILPLLAFALLLAAAPAAAATFVSVEAVETHGKVVTWRGDA